MIKHQHFIGTPSISMVQPQNSDAKFSVGVILTWSCTVAAILFLYHLGSMGKGFSSLGVDCATATSRQARTMFLLSSDLRAQCSRRDFERPSVPISSPPSTERNPWLIVPESQCLALLPDDPGRLGAGRGVKIGHHPLGHLAVGLILQESAQLQQSSVIWYGRTLLSFIDTTPKQDLEHQVRASRPPSRPDDLTSRERDGKVQQRVQAAGVA